MIVFRLYQYFLPYTTDSEYYNSLTVNIVRNLPTVADNIGKVKAFKKMDASVFTVSIHPLNAETIDGDADYLLELEDEFVQLMGRNTTSWTVISE